MNDPADILQSDALARGIERLLFHDARRLRRLWNYYRNPMRPLTTADDSSAERPYMQAQEWGLPPRITGARYFDDPLVPPQPVAGVARKEIVIENDLAWRVDTMVDYLFGQAIVLDSTAPDPARRTLIGQLLRRILAHAGGITFLQQLALMGAVYGFVDVVVGIDASAIDTSHDAPALTDTGADPQPPCGAGDLGEPERPSDPASPEPASPPAAGHPTGDARTTQHPSSPDDSPADPDSSGTALDGALARLARMIRLDIVEPTRALPFSSPTDYRRLDAYAICTIVPTGAPADLTGETPATPDGEPPLHGGWWGRFLRSASGRFASSRTKAKDRDGAIVAPSLRRTLERFTARPAAQGQSVVIDLLTPGKWMRIENGRVIGRGACSLGRLPIVHIQNTALPFEYAGASDVEPLIPLQDELNTRLSDRANRIALQAFKMYLGIGIDNFTALPVAPGRMWMSDNPDARVVEFGGDASSTAEDEHVREIREAMDKISGVTPIAAGAIKGRIGRLTSAAALRVTMLALLARTEKKRTTFGRGIEEICELALAWLDRAGVFKTDPSERGVRIHWPHPIPANEAEKLQEAEAKQRLGVPTEILLRELGY